MILCLSASQCVGVLLFIGSDAPACTGILQLRYASEKAGFFCKEFCRTSFFSHLAIRKNNDLIRRFYSTHTVVCVDTEGSRAWRGPTITRRGEVSRVIEVLCESVSDDYLAYLQKKGVAYLFAGQSRLDLPLLLEKLERLGICRLMLTGGGAMNWSFLQAGCIDELSMVLAPAVSAEPEAALFDRSRFLPGGEAKGFQLIEAKVLEDGAVWLRYQPYQSIGC